MKRESTFYLKHDTQSTSQMEPTGITWREMGGASRPGHYFSWHLVLLQVNLDDVIIKTLTCILLVLQFLPFLASSFF